MIKYVVLTVQFLVICLCGNVYSQMAELPLSQKVESATAIFEGKVIEKSSFWNAQHTLIYTSNTVSVFKVFKGDINAAEVEVITIGGTIGKDIQGVSESLTLAKGVIGVFMVQPSTIVRPIAEASDNDPLQIYGGVQGFIRYNLIEKTAADPFKKYENVQEDLHDVITSQTGETVKDVAPFSLNTVSKEAPNKKCFWSRFCKGKCKRKKR